jgi:hypothetical protein
LGNSNEGSLYIISKVKCRETYEEQDVPQIRAQPRQRGSYFGNVLLLWSDGPNALWQII